MLALPLDFSLLYGLALATLAEYQDAAPFDPSREDLGPYLDPGVQFLEEESQDAGEFHLIRPWLEFLIASSNADIRALHIGRPNGSPISCSRTPVSAPCHSASGTTSSTTSARSSSTSTPP